MSAAPLVRLLVGIVALLLLASGRVGAAPNSLIPNLQVPSAARQLVVVSSASYEPAGDVALLRTFERSSASSPWKHVFPTWEAEIGSGGLRDVRREGDHATPTGVFRIGTTIYGNEPNPGGLNDPYHRIVCGDWWDEDPYAPSYNRFVHVACGVEPPFAAWSEALWTETVAYPYFAVIDFNTDPVVAGRDAPGSGIFLHAWVDGPTEGCIALPASELLEVLRWLRPADHPYVVIGTDTEIGRSTGLLG